MMKTMIHLADPLALAARHLAERRGLTLENLIEKALSRFVDDAKPVEDAKPAESRAERPRIPLFRSSDAGLAENVDENLHGFGEW